MTDAYVAGLGLLYGLAGKGGMQVKTEERIAWLESRRNGIGSSDVPAVLGLSPWKTALDVYLSKVEPVGQMPMNGPMEWGHRAEPMIAAAIMDHHGWKLDKVPTLQHREYPWMIASPDRVNQDGEIVEIKTSARGEGFGEPETDEIPQMYWLQVQHQLEVADRNVGWLFALIGGNDFRRYRVPRDAEYMPTVYEPLAAFWTCVETRTPPEPDFTQPGIASALNRLYTPTPGTFAVLSDDAAAWADEYGWLAEEIKAREERRDELKARMIAEMKDNEDGLLCDGRRVQRKTVERKEYVCKATSYVGFKILKPAKGK